MDEQEQEQAAFESSFAGEEAGSSLSAPTGASEDALAGVQAGEAANEAANPEPELSQTSEVPPSTQAPAPQEPVAEDDPVVFDGFKRSEMRRFMENAAEVDSLKRQLDKAHGRIGELNRHVQQIPNQAAPAAAPTPKVPELPPNLKQVEEDYPDVAAYVRALVPQHQFQQQQDAPPADVQPPVATGTAQAVQAGPDPMELELALMDRMHSGWREKIASQEFTLWKAAQDAQVQQAFDSAHTADALAAVIGQYDQWAAARAAAADKSAKGQARLKAAALPSGNAPRPQAEPTEQEAFEAAFNHR